MKKTVFLAFLVFLMQGCQCGLSVLSRPQKEIGDTNAGEKKVSLGPEIPTNGKIVIFAHQSPIYDLKFSENGRKLFSVGAWKDGSAKIWEVVSGSFLGQYGPGYEKLPNAEETLCQSLMSESQWWLNSRCFKANQSKGHLDTVSSIDVSDDQFFTSSWDKTIMIWKRDHNWPQAILRGHQEKIGMVRISPDKKNLVSSSGDGFFKVWETNTGKLLRTFEAGIKANCKSQEAGCSDSEICFNGKCYPQYFDNGQLLVFLNPRLFVSIGSTGDPIMKLWDIEKGLINATNPTVGSDISLFSLAYNNKKMRLGLNVRCHEIAIYVLDQSDLVLEKFIPVNQLGCFHSISFSPDGNKIVAGDSLGQLLIIDIETGGLIKTIPHGFAVTEEKIFCNTDENRVVACPKGLMCQLRYCYRPDPVVGHLSEVISLAVSQDGVIASSSTTHEFGGVIFLHFGEL